MTKYWDSFWDADQVFYGHVLGFKGLERRAVVVVVNELEAFETIAGTPVRRSCLVPGTSLIVCGDPAFVADVGGPDLARALHIQK